ncbi:tyrosine-type recombinase/integrase, partial [Escherichia coli]|nr:tyrosine-type recombinase/integrase [Escherichia coli]
CRTGPLYEVDYLRFREILQEVKPDLPKGQATHVMRHTFATHFMMNGGNIVTLQRILGHATIQQTMTYAHFSPDYLADAMRFNPIANIAFTEQKEPAE